MQVLFGMVFFLVEPFYKEVFLKQKERKKRMPNSFGFWISINSGCERQSVLRLVVDKITVSSKLRNNDTDCLPQLGFNLMIFETFFLQCGSAAKE